MVSSILFVFVSIFASMHAEFILTPRSERAVHHHKLIKRDLRWHYFAKNLTIFEIAELSKDYIIEKDGIMTISSWYLDRVDQRNLPLSGTMFNVVGGDNVDVYVVDTGVELQHNEFTDTTGVWGTNLADNINNDCNGNGTHVASLAVGKTYGVARKARLISVKVFGCSGTGTVSNVLSGLQWILDNYNKITRLSVVNLSFSGSKSVALDTMIKRMRALGIYVVAAAGNLNQDSCTMSPSNVQEIITVASTDQNDYKASFSNYGKCVDVYAPGVSLTGAFSNNMAKAMSGTSMSAGVVSGILAVYLSRFNTQGYGMFISNFTQGVVKRNPSGTPNAMVYVV